MLKRTILLSIGLGLTLLIGLTSAIANQENPLPTNAQNRSLIGTLLNQDLLGGCGCNFYFPSDPNKRSVFGSNMDETHAWMNIDGRDVKLRLVTSVSPRGSERIGTRSSEIYQAPGTKVSVSYLTTRVCGPNEEDCEATNYDATCTVTKGTRKKAVKLKGVCGCY